MEQEYQDTQTEFDPNAVDPNLENVDFDTSTPDHDAADPLKRGKGPFTWKSFGGDGLLFSLIFHAALILIAVFWVVSRWVTQSETDPDAFVTGAGGGNNGNEAKIQEHRMKPKNAREMVKTQNRIASKSATATLALPDMPMTAATSFDTGMKAGGDSSGFGGGSGGGIGSGQGIGVGNGRNFVSAFGSKYNTGMQLEGTLFDLKKSPKGRSYGTDSNARKEQLHKAMSMLDRSWNMDKVKERYFAAPDKLYASNVFIDAIDANAATTAFGCENLIQAPGWMAYYEGWISPEETGEYRFIGMGDDVLLVGVNKKTVFYAFWPREGHGPAVRFQQGFQPSNCCGVGGNDGGNISGGQLNMLFKGSWIKMQKGKKYFIQIAFGEGAGGLAGATLGIQQKGKYMDDSGFPVFKTQTILPEEVSLRKIRGRYLLEGPIMGTKEKGRLPKFL